MKGKTASPKDRPVCNVCMSWLLRDGLAEEREPSHLPPACSTRDPTANQQPVAEAGGGCPLPRSDATSSPTPKRAPEAVGGDIVLEPQPNKKWCSVVIKDYIAEKQTNAAQDTCRRLQWIDLANTVCDEEAKA